MTLQDAITRVEGMYAGIDEEAELLAREDPELYYEARADRRALAVVLENLYAALSEAT